MSEPDATRPRRPHHRPAARTGEFFDEYPAGSDPAILAEAADRAATLLVRGAASSQEEAIADRVLHLADTEGLEALAEVWAGAPADSLAGALWRLYLLRTLTHHRPHEVAEEFEAGKNHSHAAQVIAGVAEPPGPDEVRAMTDEVLRGIATGDFVDVLHRAAAFAHVLAIGRATLHRPLDEAARMLSLSEQLQTIALAEARGDLG